MDNTILIVISLTIVGLGCGIAIYLANRFLPEEDETLKRTEEISQYLPGMNCGACGNPGCFAYAGEIAKDTSVISTQPCMTFLNDKEAVEAVGRLLGEDISAGGKKVAIVHCAGNSPLLYDYTGIDSCKGAAQLSSGYKKCPYACLGFGDCAEVCPENAIKKDEKKGIVYVDSKLCIGCGLCAKECPHNLIEIVPADLPQYLACAYTSKKDIPGREKCDLGCIHCRKCVRAGKDLEVQEVGWDAATFMPTFDLDDAKTAPLAIEACPQKVILKRESPLWKGATRKPAKEE